MVHHGGPRPRRASRQVFTNVSSTPPRALHGRDLPTPSGSRPGGPVRTAMGLRELFSRKGKTAGNEGASGTLVEDPVCHMRVDPAKSAGQSTHGGATYSFCSSGCRTKFDQDPHKYLGAHSH